MPSVLRDKQLEFLNEQTKISSNLTKFIEIIKEFKSITDVFLRFKINEQDDIIKRLDKPAIEDSSNINDLRTIDDLTAFFSSSLVPANTILAAVFLQLNNNYIDGEKLRMDGPNFIKFFKSMPLIIRITLNAMISFSIQLISFNNALKTEISKKAYVHHLFQKGLNMETAHNNLCKMSKSLKMSIDINFNSEHTNMQKNEIVYRSLGEDLSRVVNLTLEKNFEKKSADFEFFKQLTRNVNSSNFNNGIKEILNFNVDSIDNATKNAIGYYIFEADSSNICNNGRNQINLLKYSTTTPFCTSSPLDNVSRGRGGEEDSMSENLNTGGNNKQFSKQLSSIFKSSLNNLGSKKSLMRSKTKFVNNMKNQIKSFKKKKVQKNVFKKVPEYDDNDDDVRYMKDDLSIDEIKKNIDKMFFHISTDPDSFMVTEGDDYKKIKQVYSSLEEITEQLIKYYKDLLYSTKFESEIEDSELINDMDGFNKKSKDLLVEMINLKKYDDTICFEMLSIIPVQLKLFDKIRVIYETLNRNLNILVNLTNSLTSYVEVKISIERMLINSIHDNSFFMTNFIPLTSLEEVFNNICNTNVSENKMAMMMDYSKTSNNYITINGVQLAPLEYFILNKNPECCLGTSKKLVERVLRNHKYIFDHSMFLFKKMIFHTIKPLRPDFVFNTVLTYNESIGAPLVNNLTDPAAATTTNRSSQNLADDIKYKIIETPWKNTFLEENFVQGISSFHLTGKINGYITKTITFLFEFVLFLNSDNVAIENILNYYLKEMCQLLYHNFIRILFIRLIMRSKIRILSTSENTINIQVEDSRILRIFKNGENQRGIEDIKLFSGDNFKIKNDEPNKVVLMCSGLSSCSKPKENFHIKVNKPYLSCIENLLTTGDKSNLEKLDELVDVFKMVEIEKMEDNDENLFINSDNTVSDNFTTFTDLGTNIFEKCILLKNLEKVTKQIVNLKRISVNENVQCAKSVESSFSNINIQIVDDVVI